MGRLQGKTALITGASKGLGAADARRFVQEGANVIVADIDVLEGEELVRRLGGAARFLELDVRSEAAFQAVIGRIVADYGRLDVLVNNAAVVAPGSPETITEAEVHLMTAVNLNGVIFGCKHAIPAMAEGGGGSIINMSSVASLQGTPFLAGYSASKGAVEAYSRTVAVHCKLQGSKVRCNSVHPGAFATPMIQALFAGMDRTGEADDRIRDNVAAQLGKPEEVANLVLFLASDESSHITGQRFVIDDGDWVTPFAAAT